MSNDEREKQAFDQIILAMRGDLDMAWSTTVNDSQVRLNYQRTIDRFSKSLEDKVKNRQITWRQAAEQAQEGRTITR